MCMYMHICATNHDTYDSHIIVYIYIYTHYISYSVNT